MIEKINNTKYLKVELDDISVGDMVYVGEFSSDEEYRYMYKCEMCDKKNESKKLFRVIKTITQGDKIVEDEMFTYQDGDKFIYPYSIWVIILNRKQELLTRLSNG